MLGNAKTMLKETPVAQKEKGLLRRWFEDEYFQLIVWYKNETNAIIGFQLLYDIYNNEHSFTWTETTGFAHNKIDDERKINKYPQSPILVEDGVFNHKAILLRFQSSCHEIDKNITQLVLFKINEYGARHSVDSGSAGNNIPT